MRRIIRFKVGQELYIRNDLSDFKCWMVPGAKVSITAIRVTSNRDTQSIENRYAIEYKFIRVVFGIGEYEETGKDFVWEKDLMRAIGQRKNNYY